MKIITRMELHPGMILGEDVLHRGEILYAAGTKVDSLMIERLNRYSIMCVTIKEAVDLASTHYEKIRFNENFRTFEKAYTRYLRLFKETMINYVMKGERISSDFLLNIHRELFDILPSGTSLLDYLYNMVPSEDELTFAKALNSALLCGLFADWMSLNEEAKKTLILCGFYYDIGKLKLPYQLLWKPGRLTDEEYALVREHPVIGYSMVCNLNVNVHVKNAVLMHHERMDAKGYPYQLSGDKIDIYARYIAIVDSYTAMASPRAYRSAMSPLQILSVLEKNMETYDIQILLPIMRCIANAQIGTGIQLTDDSVWEVMIINSTKLSRPILKNEKNELLDLMTHPELNIVKIV